MNNRLSYKSAVLAKIGAFVRHSLSLIAFLCLSNLATANPIPSGSQLTIVAPVTITSPGTYSILR